MLDFFMSFYYAFAKESPIIGVLLLATGALLLFDGGTAEIGVYLLLAGLAQLVCNVYVAAVAERLNRGETLSGVEKPAVFGAMTVLIVIGGALFMAWQAVLLVWEAFKSSFR